MKNRIATIFIILMFFQFSVVAQEEDQITKNPILTQKFNVEAGAFFNLKSVKISGNADLPDYGIDFDDAVGLSNYKSTFFANFEWRFSRMWKLSAEYLSINNTNTATLKEDFPIGDYVFQEGTSVSVGTGMKLYRIFVGRVITKGPKHEFGAGLGVHAMNFDLSLAGKAIIEGEDDPSFAQAGSDLGVPLPNIVIWYTWAPTEKWSFEARTDWFGIKMGEVTGLLWDIEPKVNFEITKNIGVGASYRFFKFEVDVDTADWGGNLEMQYKGPTLSIHGRF